MLAALRILLASLLVGGALALVSNGVAMADQFVSITDAGYDPPVITIHAGETISWTNGAAGSHDVTSDDGSFASGPIAPGEHYAVTLTELGTFNYHSDAGGFQGRVVVVAIDVTNAPAATVISTRPFQPTPNPSTVMRAGFGDPGPLAIAAIVVGVVLLAVVTFAVSRKRARAVPRSAGRRHRPKPKD